MNQDFIPPVEQELLHSEWKEEAAAVPLDNLEIDEVIVLKKCMKEETFTEEEFKLLKKILQEYRTIIKDYNLKDAEENIKNNKELVKTEKNMLDLLDEFNQQKFVLNLPLHNEVVELEFEIRQITDSRQVEHLQTQLGLFKDFSEDEKKLYKKSQIEGNLTKREKAIINGLNERLNQVLDENEDEFVINILANQLIMVDENNTSDFETRKKFWSKIPNNIRIGAFMEVKDIIGIGDIKNSELFQFR